MKRILVKHSNLKLHFVDGKKIIKFYPYKVVIQDEFTKQTKEFTAGSYITDDTKEIDFIKSSPYFYKELEYDVEKAVKKGAK